MEFTVSNAVGIPKSSIITFRAGGTRRQVTLEALDKPMKFPCRPEDIASIKVDVCAAVSHARVPFDPAEPSYDVVLDPIRDDLASLVCDGAEDMALSFDINRVENIDSSFLVETEDFSRSKRASVSHRHRQNVESQGYLEEHGLVTFMQYLMHGLMQDKPADPYNFLRRQIDMKSAPKEPKRLSFAPGGYPNAPGLPPVPPRHASKQSQEDKDLNSLMEKTRKASKESQEGREDLERQAKEASERLRDENQKLRDTAKQMREEYEKLVQDTKELQMRKKQVGWSKQPFNKFYRENVMKQSTPFFWTRLHANFPSQRPDPTELSRPPTREAATQSDGKALQDGLVQTLEVATSQVAIQTEVEPEPLPPPIAPAKPVESLNDEDESLAKSLPGRQKKLKHSWTTLDGPQRSRYSLLHEELMEKTAPLLVKMQGDSSTWMDVESMQDEVGLLAEENEQLIGDLAQMREMIKVVRTDFREMMASVDADMPSP